MTDELPSGPALQPPGHTGDLLGEKKKEKGKKKNAPMAYLFKKILEKKKSKLSLEWQTGAPTHCGGGVSERTDSSPAALESGLEYKPSLEGFKSLPRASCVCKYPHDESELNQRHGFSVFWVICYICFLIDIFFSFSSHFNLSVQNWQSQPIILCDTCCMNFLELPLRNS